MYRILVVDDDLDMNACLTEQLEAAGFVADGVTTLGAAEAAVLAPTSDISAILLDVHLPDGDGRDLCTRLRGRGVTMPVLILSGSDTEDDVVLGLNNGADSYVRKPFVTTELVARLRHLLPSAAPAQRPSMLRVVGGLEFNPAVPD